MVLQCPCFPRGALGGARGCSQCLSSPRPLCLDQAVPAPGALSSWGRAASLSHLRAGKGGLLRVSSLQSMVHMLLLPSAPSLLPQTLPPGRAHGSSCLFWWTPAIVTAAGSMRGFRQCCLWKRSNWHRGSKWRKMQQDGRQTGVQGAGFGNPGLALRVGHLRYLIVGFLSPVLDEVGTGSTKKAQARHSLQVNTLMYANKGRKQSTRIASHPAQDGDRVWPAPAAGSPSSPCCMHCTGDSRAGSCHPLRQPSSSGWWPWFSP